MIRKMGIIILVFLIALGISFLIVSAIIGKWDSNLWSAYFIALAAIYTTFAGTDSIKKYGRSKYYRPELDDEHPDVREIAKENLRKTGSSIYE